MIPTTSQLFALRQVAQHRDGWWPPDNQTRNMLEPLRRAGYVTRDKDAGYKITWDGTRLLNELDKRL